MSSHSEVPTKEEVSQKLDSLIHEELTREDASEWARPWILRLEEISDPDVRRAIVWLDGSDSPSTDRPYLYSKEDFQQWLSELRC